MEPFASPNQLDPELRSFLQDACRNLCNWFAESASASPLPGLISLPDIAPELEGLSQDLMLEDLQLIMDSAYRPSHPGAIAHLDPPPLTSSVVADLISAGINNNLLAYELSPCLTRLERKLCHWIALRLGMPSTSGGVLASGGTISNLMALVLARRNSDLQYDPRAIVLVSSDAHISLSKSVGVMGLTNDSLRKIPTDIGGQLSLDSIKTELNNIRDEGRKCFAVVATAGTTIRGAIDPLTELSELCRYHQIWLHVDGAIGGVFGLANSTSHLVEGISFANSISINPQKLLGVAKTSSVLLVDHMNHLKTTFGTDMPYIEPIVGDDFHGGEVGLQGTRQADVLKLWLGLRQLGENGIEFLLEKAIKRRRYIHDLIDVNKFEVVSGPLHLISLTPKGLTKDESKLWSIQTREFLLSEKFMLSRPFHNDRYYLKLVLGNPHTESVHLKKLSNLINNSINK